MSWIGLLSDSHGRVATTRQAIALLLREGATTLIHLGDMGSLDVLDELAACPLQSPQPVSVHVVFGNVDYGAAELGRYAVGLGLTVHHPVGKLDTAGGELVFMHGHDHGAMVDALARKVRYLCHGHTHEACDRRVGVTRVINPGALFRAARYTVALLDPRTDELRLLNVDGSAEKFGKL